MLASASKKSLDKGPIHTAIGNSGRGGLAKGTNQLIFYKSSRSLFIFCHFRSRYHTTIILNPPTEANSQRDLPDGLHLPETVPVG